MSENTPMKAAECVEALKKVMTCLDTVLAETLPASRPQFELAGAHLQYVIDLLDGTAKSEA